VARIGGFRTALFVPLRTDGVLRGHISASRHEVQPFSEKEISLLENFAAQAVIAMENARLITETREALEQQTATAETLQVINSSPGNVQPVFDAMLDKALRLCGADFGVLWTYDGERVHATALRGVPPKFAEFLTRTSHPVGSENAHGRLLSGEPVVHIADITEDEAYRSGDPILTGNLEKIAEHGKRADNIVKSMLEHSRGSSGERRSVDLNGLIEEALNLAYHGARAQDHSFNITLECDYAAGMALIKLAPQDITRLFLNLFSNGFYAATKRQKEGNDRNSSRP
jgi:hypothetical protein